MLIIILNTNKKNHFIFVIFLFILFDYIVFHRFFYTLCRYYYLICHVNKETKKTI